MRGVGLPIPPERVADFARDRILGPDWPSGAGAPDIIVDPEASAKPPHLVASIQAAVDAAYQLSTHKRCIIEIRQGHYRGPVIVPRDGPALTFRGPGRDLAILAAPIDAQMTGRAYGARFGQRFETSSMAVRDAFERIAALDHIATGNTAVLRLERSETIVSGLTIRNDYACNRPEAATQGAVPDGYGRFSQGQHQAVALHVAGADRITLRDLCLSSFQDTLYLQSPGRSWITACEIEGDVDFVFGGGTAVFEDCEFRTRGLRGAHSWVFAPSTAMRDPSGFVIHRCVFTHDGAEAGRTGGCFLGRQWFEGVRATPYGQPTLEGYSCHPSDRSAFDAPRGTISLTTLEAVGKCVLLDCTIGEHINRQRPWDDWASGAWSPRYRPVQASPAAFLRHLSDWLEDHDLDYGDLDPADIWLGAHGTRFARPTDTADPTQTPRRRMPER